MMETVIVMLSNPASSRVRTKRPVHPQPVPAIKGNRYANLFILQNPGYQMRFFRISAASSSMRKDTSRASMISS